jgi:predicted nucleotidyltransferase
MPKQAMSEVSPKIQTEIKRRLAEVERDEYVTILYACESGSRAWGFESQNSDYDVHFIYTRPRDWYLTIDLERRRDVIERPINDEIDLNGWDVRKALQLFAKTNPPLIEWLFSPVVYLQHGWFADHMRRLAPGVYNFTSARYHYLHMAEGNFREYLKGETVLRKKYLYVLRPLLAVTWIEKDLGIVPMEFDRLVAGTITEPGLKSEIEELVNMKRAGEELDRGPRFHAIHSFIESELERHSTGSKTHATPSVDIDTLSQLFRTVLNDYGSQSGPAQNNAMHRSRGSAAS